MRYAIRCGGCGMDAPLVGELLSALSEQVVAFQADHAHAEGVFAIDVAPATIVINGQTHTLVAA